MSRTGDCIVLHKGGCPYMKTRPKITQYQIQSATLLCAVNGVCLYYTRPLLLNFGVAIIRGHGFSVTSWKLIVSPIYNVSLGNLSTTVSKHKLAKL